MAADVLRYSVHGKVKWEKKANNRSNQNCVFYSDVITKDAIFISVNCISENARILKFSKTGKTLWENKTEFSRVEFKNYWPINNLIGYMGENDGPTLPFHHHIVDAVNAIDSAPSGILVGESKKFLLIDTTEYENPADADWKLKLSDKLIKTVPYSVYGIFGNLAVNNFATPPRKSCDDYRPNIGTLSSENGLTKPEYAANIVKGEYIYAHRADGCGKFTYKFHWTDPRDSAPQILSGWQ